MRASRRRCIRSTRMPIAAVSSVPGGADVQWEPKLSRILVPDLGWVTLVLSEHGKHIPRPPAGARISKIEMTRKNGHWLLSMVYRDGRPAGVRAM